MNNINIDKKQVLRFLGYGNRKPHEKIINMLDEENEKAIALIKPNFYSKVLKIESKENNKITLKNGYILEGQEIYKQLKHCFFIAFNIATVGKEIEEAMRDYMAKRQTMKSLIYDKIGVVLLDYVVDENRNNLIENLKKDELNITCEISPGEKDWNIENLNLIFEVLKNENKSVKLNEYSMMEPIKSTAFIWGIGKGKAMACGHRCSRCKNPCKFKEGNW